MPEELYYAVIIKQQAAQKQISFAFKAGCICVAFIGLVVTAIYALISKNLLARETLIEWPVIAVAVWVILPRIFPKRFCVPIGKGNEPFREATWTIDEKRKAYITQCVERERLKKVLARVE